MLMMSADMEYNYEAALTRQNFTESDVNELRAAIKKFKNVPKALSSKKVRKSIYWRTLEESNFFLSCCAS